MFMKYAPKEWWDKKEQMMEENCNGCGSELDGSNKLVPNDILWLDITEDCCTHDDMYARGKTWQDKLFADNMFLSNMTARILNAAKGKSWYEKDKLLMVPRLFIACRYYQAVVIAGNNSYWDKKKPNSRNEITFKGEFR